MPDHDDASDLSPPSVNTLRAVANVLGVIAGVLFLIAFGLGLARHGELRFLFLGMGVLFLLFPLLTKRIVRSGP
jgi:hypothetical protein